MVPEVLGAEDEVAPARVDRPGLPLDVPVDLALQHYPPLVVMVVVRVVGLAGRMADQERLDVVGQHERLRPGRLALFGDQLRQAALQRPQLEQRDACGHVVPPGRRAPGPPPLSTAGTSPPGRATRSGRNSTLKREEG